VVVSALLSAIRVFFGGKERKFLVDYVG